jgi:hypothetical protein
MNGFKEFVISSRITPAAKEQTSESDVVFLYLQKTKIEEIAIQTGRSIGEIYRILDRNRITPNRLKTNHQNVLYYHEAGFNVPEIAGYTGYTERNVRYILKNRGL